MSQSNKVANSESNTVVRTVADTAETAKEVVTDAARLTKDTLEHGANDTLQFLGVPIDINTLTQLAIDFSGRLVSALLIFFVGQWIGKRIVGVAKHIMVKSRLDRTAANFLGNLLYGLMLVTVILASLNKLGVNTNSFVAVLGAAGVAIGVSLKDQLSNLAAGVLIVIFRPFGRGDLVEIGGKLGTVLDISLVNTRIRTAHNHEIIIPNGDIMTSASINYSSLPNRRVDVEVGIGYNADIREARKVMIGLAEAHPNVLDDPKPTVIVTALADSSVDLVLRVWTNNDDWFMTQADLLEQVKYAFDEAGIDIPFPNRTVQIEGLQMDKVKTIFESNAKHPEPNSSNL
ncbi:mechanosensitive ion channel family protein [Moraxella catarrhalis]|mgnify:FL=1|uniref:mechanosensitive ion channel family protein n=1 Tax=Moraxella catarrhalis TaxID=480 RepID=UPI000202B14E|nr:mechanosensitive ion channel domain-containing protein [Moraxella catarrhalis]EGE09676.1 MscS mechanosensitive ion channel [Moraxella catarrhalis 46P47B1]MCG6813942.1 mechanosensitive ion channel [Moraxella catarrhalis]MCG6835499.1 mechanosensitive ion channel [Moraxella catarrhalis]MPW49843.1 mechanosensitive ion channel family protein [Moraxella catarrhalis]MPW53340.1 mechanosensitive ion channel family protein [Moraxella catarrhalis]